MIAVSYQYVAAKYCFTFVACLISFGLGIFLFAIAAIDDVKNDLRVINEKAKFKRKRLHALKRLANFVQFHSSLKQLGHHIYETHSVILL